MAEANAATATGTTAEVPKTQPGNTAQNLPSQIPPAQNRKRKLDYADIQNSSYFKIRAIIKDLRPHFVEVLQTPDFRNCKAAHEIRKQMKLMMDLYKQLKLETVSIGKCKNQTEGQPLPGESRHEQRSLERRQEKQVEHSQPESLLEKSPEEKPPSGGTNSEKKKVENGRIQGTYVVGGSVFGWNFIMYPGSKPVYCGVTKESRRAAK